MTAIAFTFCGIMLLAALISGWNRQEQQCKRYSYLFMVLYVIAVIVKLSTEGSAACYYF